MISPVSFRSSSNAAFSDMISRPQTYIQKDPSAASSINSESPKKKSSFGKALVGFLAVSAAICGTLALGKNKGLFNKLVEKGGKLGTVGETLNKAGQYVIDKAGAVKNWVMSKLKKTHDIQNMEIPSARVEMHRVTLNDKYSEIVDTVL